MARSRFSGVAATLATLAGGAIGFSVALFLRSLIVNTPAQVKPTTFYWWFVLLTAAGALWGVATHTMKQLEEIQGYRPSPLRNPRRPVVPDGSQAGPPVDASAATPQDESKPSDSPDR